ncbi:MAG: alpha-N-acetylglucosaminidase C-terminal domain-containing protein, partial [Muribaculaceae bacterium]
INHLADRHYGESNENVRKAWDILFNDVHIQVPRTLGILPNYRPALINNDKRIGINYDNNKLIEAWSLLLDIDKASTNEIHIDLITVGRQVLGNYFAKVKNRFDSAYYKQDANAMRYNAEILHSLLSDLDALNAFNYRCSVEPWIQDARNYATTPEIADYYEKNARNLITTWGGKLNDYASRTWAGLINDYYAKRWEVYTSTLIDAVQNNATLDAQEMKTKIEAVENNWVNSTEKIETVKRYDILSFSRMIYNKYRNDF